MKPSERIRKHFQDKNDLAVIYEILDEHAEAIENLKRQHNPFLMIQRYEDKPKYLTLEEIEAVIDVATSKDFYCISSLKQAFRDKLK